MPSLSTELRNLLEKTVLEAREVAEKGADAALTALAVGQGELLAPLASEQRDLRNALRTRATQLGQGNRQRGLKPLIEEVGYTQWHRLLFARVLAENGLLIHPEGVPVTLDDCATLAAELGEPDRWALAVQYTTAMLPGLFGEGPAAKVRLAPEYQTRLEALVEGLPPAVFTADDTLGWVYQFWQAKRKDEVNNSEVKIGAAELPAVTQLFTEDYMVRFLLENSLGAWWAGRHPDSPLLAQFEYLRFIEPQEKASSSEQEQQDDTNDGDVAVQAGQRIPAAGTFPGWPERVAEVTVMDPCCGSGHFLVRAFDMLRQMRMEEERLGAAEAGDAVLRDNLFGLELDPRCTQIAAFSLALAAWKTGGYRKLPLPQVACSGLPVGGQRESWLQLANGDTRLRQALADLYDLFAQAPLLGSLMDPATAITSLPLLAASLTEVEPLLRKALERKAKADDPTAALFGEAAAGAALVARLLATRYTLIATNVPYLSSGRHDDILRDFCREFHPLAKTDLATCFIERCRSLTAENGSYALVTPQNWTFLTSYRGLRKKLLTEQTWRVVAILGEHGFESSQAAGAFTALFILSNSHPEQTGTFSGLEVDRAATPSEKARLLRETQMQRVSQVKQLLNPDTRILFDAQWEKPLLSTYATSLHGLTTGDLPRMHRYFWELGNIGEGWIRFQTTVTETQPYGGRSGLLFWNDGHGPIDSLPGARKDGQAAWGQRGVVISQMRNLPCTLYTGEAFDNNTAVILPQAPEHLPAIWAFCSSPEFSRAVRRVDKALKVTNATLVKVPFDLAVWQRVADEQGPLPEPYSNDPTQWLFKGHPVGSTAPLQVAVARLLGYRWPEQPESDGLEGYAGDDGIVCIPPVAGELPGAERLRVLLAAAYGEDWSPARQEALLAKVGYGGQDLERWLRDGFFEQHCKLFHNRPFVWQVWDGRSDGFSALVNYHRLDAALLDRLIYTYLGAWIHVQEAQTKAGEAGAEGRLIAAQDLQKKLQLIREGEPPYDIYVRWKSLAEQPIGWEPDLNDGVRLNIRPFVTAGVLRRRFSINWQKDRGKNPDGSERVNDLHYTRAEKIAERAEAHTGQNAKEE